MAISVSVTILGSGTAVPWRGRSSPGLVVRAESGTAAAQILVDPSAGSTQRMVQRGYRLEDLTHVLFSHYHLDHTGDLAPLLFALKSPRFHDLGESGPLELCGPRGLKQLHSSLERVYGPWIQHGDRVRIRELDAPHGFFTMGPLEVSSFLVEHTDNSVAYRFESRGGPIVAYSGDTDHCDGIVDAARGADALILECAFPEGRKHAGHLIPSEAGRIAAAANPRQVILTHLYPECHGQDMLGPFREQFSGDVSIAEDGLTLHL